MTTGKGPKKSEAPASSPAVVMPGAPGEEGETGSPEDLPEDAGSDQWNEADAHFMAMMIPHHAQAVEMTALVPDRAQSEQLKSLASRMHLEQGAEIDYMAEWLTARGLEVPPEAGGTDSGHHGHHDGAPMEGTLTEEEMAALAAAEGTAFDRLFLEGMIKHHRGALTMCHEVQVEGIDLTTQELAAHIASGQSAEIARMQDLLAALPE
ncbi:DUF305 domain-containing protein [Zhihengliuella sp.]|uniref:DUF305 domain-containing protein n=1 Tax=Zhihengliuella sp. TaxID=1954483 RepID=UPI002811F259|nr:DUF305 domain-containing protein [Zhihengliuella sp.]